MKFTVTMKDPDTLDDAIQEAIEDGLASSDLDDEDEVEAVGVLRKAKVKAICAKWFEHGEYLRVEIDTDAGTCTVLEKGGAT